MNEPACGRLDAYLASELSDLERATFAAHLQHCAACREAVAEQDHLDELLARATTELEPFPRDLANRIERQLRAAERRRLAIRVAGLAASLLLTVGGVLAWRLTREAPRREAIREAAVEVEPPARPPETPDPRSLVRVTFPASLKVIDVPIETSSPDVTIIWLYPAVMVVPPHDSTAVLEKE